MGKKFRKRLHNALSIFSCCCQAPQKSEQKLQTLLCKSLEIQMEERQSQFQIKNTLIYLASLLEKFGNNQSQAKGHFGLVAQISQDKAIQSANTPSTSQTIQTSNDGELSEFKLSILQHMRQLKQDVLLLKQLLCNPDPLACVGTLLRQQDYDFDFFQSKTRALNFAKFYKLRKLDEGKKKSFVKVDTRIRRRCNF